jgi:hypothetical protein
VTPFPTALPTTRTPEVAGQRHRLPLTVVAQEDTRLGWPPIRRRRMTAGGVPPVAPGSPPFDHSSLFGAVAPTTGDSCFLELPLLNSTRFQRWLGHLAQTCAASLHLLVRDNGALHTATILRWPLRVAAGPFPPYRPERNPMARLRRDLKEPWADPVAKHVAKPLDA